jgi:tetratricopeptide (TPR) repeat protein
MATPALKIEAKQRTGSAIFASRGMRRLIAALALSLLALLLYNPVTEYGFVNFDDPAYVTGNRHIQAGLTWHTVAWAFRATEHANWHPLTWLSHTLDYQLFHLKAAGHHYDSVLLHVVCVVLLFLFLESATGLVGRSAIVAALFAVHPINVESVAWISERKNVLCAVFFFLGLWAYEWYAQNPNLKRYLAVAFSFALALMSKPMAITFPCLLLVLDYWPLERMREFGSNGSTTSSPHPARALRWLVLEKVPLLLFSAASGVITVIAQKSGGAFRTQYEFPLRAENAVVSYARYIGKLFWPTRLAALYPFPRNGVPAWEIALSVLVLLAISGAVLLQRHRRYLAVGWFWLLGTLVPVIGLVQVGEQSMADRYAYIPFVGLFIAIVWGIGDWAESRRIAQRYTAFAALLALVVLAAVTRTQMKYWESSTALWAHTLAVTGPNFVAEDNMGAELIGEGKIDAARVHFQAAIDINPQDPFSQLDIGVCDQRMGDLQSAIAHYQAALRTSTETLLRSTALSNLGSTYRLAGNYDAARENYTAVLRSDPQNVVSLIGLGLIAQKNGDFNGASSYYSRAAAAEPWAVNYLLLAQALHKAGRNSEAAAAFEQAKRIAPSLDADQNEVKGLLAQ